MTATSTIGILKKGEDGIIRNTHYKHKDCKVTLSLHTLDHPICGQDVLDMKNFTLDNLQGYGIPSMTDEIDSYEKQHRDFYRSLSSDQQQCLQEEDLKRTIKVNKKKEINNKEMENSFEKLCGKGNVRWQDGKPIASCRDYSIAPDL